MFYRLHENYTYVGKLIGRYDDLIRKTEVIVIAFLDITTQMELQLRYDRKDDEHLVLVCNVNCFIQYWHKAIEKYKSIKALEEKLEEDQKVRFVISS
jgi:predicted metalloenzyme YecM